jgi:hypothetical protein
MATDDDTVIFMNLISGSDFYEYMKHTDSEKKYYRIPCLYEWYEQNALMDEVLDEALREAFSQDYFSYKRKWRLKKGKRIFEKINQLIKGSR